MSRPRTAGDDSAVKRVTSVAKKPSVLIPWLAFAFTLITYGSSVIRNDGKESQQIETMSHSLSTLTATIRTLDTKITELARQSDRAEAVIATLSERQIALVTDFRDFRGQNEINLGKLGERLDYLTRRVDQNTVNVRVLKGILESTDSVRLNSDNREKLNDLKD